VNKAETATTATYAGDANFTGSTSAAEPHTVNGPIVTPSKHKPTATVAAGQCSSTRKAKASGRIDLTFADADGDPLTLALASNSNRALASVTLGGSGTKRTLTVAAGTRRGKATISFNLSDGNATGSLVVTVLVGSAKNEKLSGTGGADMIRSLQPRLDRRQGRK
jgi:hypothetical protein